MFIQTEETPNPATLKFLPGCSVTGGGPVDFPEPAGAARSPLARGLFAVEGVTGVFLGADFVTVTKSAGKTWDVMKPPVLGAIMEHFLSGLPVLEDSVADDHDGEEDDALVGQIKELLDERVRPVVARDGGDITFHGFKDGVVFLNMKGSCSGCPSSVATLRSGIENLLRHYIPEVKEVRAVR
ncbi:MAG: NifU family protein [Rhodospirillaceae bacterium]